MAFEELFSTRYRKYFERFLLLYYDHQNFDIMKILSID